MATVSSHILDSITGSSAAGIRVQLLLRTSGDESVVFDVNADQEGRIAENVELGDHSSDAEFELVMYGADYFATQGITTESMVRQIVIRLAMDDNQRRYHLPVMLSPHSYSTWWSS